MHSTTKYLAGHSDALGGALCVGDAELAAALRDDRAALGSQPGAMETWLLLRSLRTLHLRVARQSATAAALAEWLHRAASGEAGHPLSGASRRWRTHAPVRSVARRRGEADGGRLRWLFALELSTEEAAKALPAELALFRDATSLGGVESLIEW